MVAVNNTQLPSSVVNIGRAENDEKPRERVPRAVLNDLPPKFDLGPAPAPINLWDKGAPGVSASSPRALNSKQLQFAQNFIKNQASDVVEHIDTGSMRSRDDVHQFFERRRPAAEAQFKKLLPNADPQQIERLSYELSARNTAAYEQAGRPTDFNPINAIGYLLMVGAEVLNGTCNANAPEATYAQAIGAQVANGLHEASLNAEGIRPISLDQATHFVSRAGAEMSKDAKGWRAELPEVQKQAHTAAVPSPDQGFLAHYAQTRQAKSSDVDPMQLRVDSHAAFVRATAEADEIRARDADQERVIVAARVAARRAVNGSGPPAGGPLSEESV